MTPLLTEIPAYAPVLAYLVMVCGLLAATGTCPTWVHPVAVAAGLPARVVVDGFTEPALNVGVAAFFFVVLVYFAGRSVSGVTLFSLVTVIALTPLDAWPGIAVALVVVAAVATRRVLRGHGSGRVSWIVLDTMEGMGVRPGRGIGLPSAALVPTKEAFAAPGSAVTAPTGAHHEDIATEHHDAPSAYVDAVAPLASPQPDSGTMYLPPYLLGGVTAGMVLATYLG